MYLLAIVMLIIGTLSLYAQVLTVEAARIASRQTFMAQAMMTWHQAAVSMASAIITTGTYTAPCSLTYTLPLGSTISQCLPPLGVPQGTVTDGSTPPIANIISSSPNVSVHLPTGYNTNNQFYSVLYRDAATSSPYVITFVRPPNPATDPGYQAPGYIMMPNGHMTSVTLADLLHQFEVSGIASYMFGTISNNGQTLNTIGYLRNTFTVFYTIPAGVIGAQNDGAIAIASSAIGS